MAWTSEEFQQFGDHAREIIASCDGSTGAAVCMLSDAVAQVGAVLAEVLAEMRRPKVYVVKRGTMAGHALILGNIIAVASVRSGQNENGKTWYRVHVTTPDEYAATLDFDSAEDAAIDHSGLLAALESKP